MKLKIVYLVYVQSLLGLIFIPFCNAVKFTILDVI